MGERRRKVTTWAMAAPYELPTGAALLRCTASGIEDLLEQASDHVTAAMQQFDHEEQRGSDESAATVPPPGMSGWRSKRVRTALVAILRRAFKGKSAQKEETSPKRVKRGQVDADEFEYRRLKNGFTGLFEHVQALDKSREGLKRAVAQLRIHSEDLHRIAQDAAERERERGLDRASLSTLFAAYEPALRDVVVRVPQLAHLLVMAKETHSVRRMQATLDERVAPITQSKLHQLQHFQVPRFAPLFLRQQVADRERCVARESWRSARLSSTPPTTHSDRCDAKSSTGSIALRSDTPAVRLASPARAAARRLLGREEGRD